MRFVARLTKTVPVLVLALLLQGCAGGWLLGGAAVVAGGASAYGYVKGTYRAALDAPIFEVDRAVRAVAARARLVEKKRECTGRRAGYVYEDLSDAKVYIKLRALTRETSRIYIRFGRLGDRDNSEIFLRAVEQELQANPGQ
ncbi:MAG: DUF3568 family protein [Victivallales bacterium]|jgi:hypothetical protein|nr:DUF3568 family protein [Victivallales bacterium]MBT7302654.1 DUF3568 family protein [Victivallales bacterium]